MYMHMSNPRVFQLSLAMNLTFIEMFPSCTVKTTQMVPYTMARAAATLPSANVLRSVCSLYANKELSVRSHDLIPAITTYTRLFRLFCFLCNSYVSMSQYCGAAFFELQEYKSFGNGSKAQC